jgi:hypothetical protein
MTVKPFDRVAQSIGIALPTRPKANTEDGSSLSSSIRVLALPLLAQHELSWL